jgi:4-hydroxybenzoate polyprenyltransferase
MGEKMTSNDRPFSVTGVAWLYIAVGVAMFAYHSPELVRLEKDAFLIEFTELLGLTAGVFMLRGHNWARWLALAWAAFHVALTVIPPFHGLAVHVIILAGIAVILLRSDANQYFRGHRTA